MGPPESVRLPEQPAHKWWAARIGSVFHKGDVDRRRGSRNIPDNRLGLSHI